MEPGLPGILFWKSQLNSVTYKERPSGTDRREDSLGIYGLSWEVSDSHISRAMLCGLDPIMADLKSCPPLGYSWSPRLEWAYAYFCNDAFKGHPPTHTPEDLECGSSQLVPTERVFRSSLSHLTSD